MRRKRSGGVLATILGIIFVLGVALTVAARSADASGYLVTAGVFGPVCTSQPGNQC